MSLIPFIMDDMFRDINRQCDMHHSFTPSSVLDAYPVGNFLRPWRHIGMYDSGISAVDDGLHNFTVNLDVQQFKPEEISVKVADDYLSVEAKHEERKDDHGYISRQFVRRYKLPDSVEADKIQSKLSSDGVLSLIAPKKVQDISGGRSIPIEHTNKPALKQKRGSGTSTKAGEKMES